MTGVQEHACGVYIAQYVIIFVSIQSVQFTSVETLNGIARATSGFIVQALF